METASRHAQPVAAGLARKLCRFLRFCKPLLAGKQFFIAQADTRALMTSDRTKLRFNRRAILCSKLGTLQVNGKDLRQRQPGTINHNRLVACVQRTF